MATKHGTAHRTSAIHAEHDESASSTGPVGNSYWEVRQPVLMLAIPAVTSCLHDYLSVPLLNPTTQRLILGLKPLTPPHLLTENQCAH